MITRCLKNQKGATLVLVTLFMLVLLGFVGLVIDVGNLYMERSRMQTAVDMAALAGAPNLPDHGAIKVAQENIKDNGEDPTDPANLKAIIGSYTLAGTATPTLIVRLGKEVPTYMIGLFGFPKVTIAVQGVAISVEEANQYTIFSNTDMEFKNTLEVNGSVYSGGNIKFNGVPPSGTIIRGDADALGVISDILHVEPYEERGGQKHTSVSKTMPEYPPLDCQYKFDGDGTRTIEIKKQQWSQVDTGMDVKIRKGQTLTIDMGSYQGNGAINIRGDGDVRITGVVQSVGSIYGNGTGTITIEPSSFHLTGRICVPNGKVKMACGSFFVMGCLVANEIEFLAGSYKFMGLTDPSSYHRTSRLIE